MILYLSGNFPQLVSPGKEASFRKNLLERGHPYHRLVTYFYPKHCATVFNILKEAENKDWHDLYKQTLVDGSGITPEQAQEVLEAAKEEFDYTDSPVDTANEELSYWGD